MTLLLVLAGSAALIPAVPTQAAGVVGDGTPASCDETALDSALTSGGLVTFNCGASPVTITVTSEKVIASGTQLDGGGLVTLSGGSATRIFFVSPGATLELNNITVSGGGSAAGGAIHNEGTLAIATSTLSNNGAEIGGAILNSGILTVASSTFSGNSAAQFGGSISNAGSLAIADSTFGMNTADLGGAIHNSGTLSMTTSTFSMNGASLGGAIHNTGTLHVTGSTFSDNSANAGGALHSGGALTLTNSTFSGNSAGFGGAIVNDGPLTITNGTFSDNSAVNEGGALYNFGAVTIAASILAGNGAVAGPNCFNGFGTLTSQGSNLSDDASCAFTAPGDIQDSFNVKLGPLADNGGPTETRLPLAGSAAIDAGACLTSQDQRGLPRPSGVTCDTGAVEVQQTTYPLCVDRHTGVVVSPLHGDCRAGSAPLDPAGKSFCIDPYTGRLQFFFGQACPPQRRTHSLPEDGDLLTCVSRYTGVHRWVRAHARCTAWEVPSTIPAMP
jgi:predicted outer membrane repeat protein